MQRLKKEILNFFFHASKIVIAKESEREGLGTRLQSGMHDPFMHMQHTIQSLLLIQAKPPSPFINHKSHCSGCIIIKVLSQHY